MTPLSYVCGTQRLWALRRGLPVYERGYTTSQGDNLFEPLNPAVEQQFNDADGGELKQGKDRLPKMQALHSSSALAVNVFHYWRDRDKTPLAKALQIPSGGLDRIDFERLMPIAEQVNREIFPKDPNVDVVLGYRAGAVGEIGIESKFSEAYGTHDGLKAAYLEDPSLWTGLPHCQDFAKSVQGPAKVEGLNTPQLLKHLLGMRKSAGGRPFWLVYLWYATPGAELGQHYQQLETFKTLLAKDGVRFHFMTYQELICRLAEAERPEHPVYIDYLADRYL